MIPKLLANFDLNYQKFYEKYSTYMPPLKMIHFNIDFLLRPGIEFEEIFFS